MAAALEEILSQLCVADNTVIQQATQQLKTLFGDSNFVPSLCQVLGTSQNVQVRQYAAVLLRKKILKSKQWAALQGGIAETIRENILQLLLQEPEKIVRTAIAQVIATAAKHDLPTNAWPQLFTFITQNATSENPQQREVGMYLLFSVSSSAAEQLKPHLVAIVNLVSGVLDDQQSSLVPFFAVKTLAEIVFYVGDDALKPIQKIVPQILQVIKNLITVDQEKACEAFEVFDEMLECDVVIITPHIKSAVMFSLEVAANQSLESNIRIKAMSFICSLTRLKKKQILKHQLVTPILTVMFPVMCEHDDDDDDDEEAEDVESQKPAQLASQVLDVMAMHLPPEKYIPHVMSLVEQSLPDSAPVKRRAAFIAMAVVVEGCADYITNKYLQAVLQCVCKGLSDPDQMVRNGALFAMGQFSEHLQPEISKYAAEILPLLFQYLVQVSRDPEHNGRALTRSYYALEMFCQNLGKDIAPYLPQLMEHLITVLKTSTSLRPKELAISALGATVSAAEKLVCPYFQEIINHLREYLVVKVDCGEEMFKLQIQTIDTLGVLARCVGVEMFEPLTKESIQFGLNLLNDAEDPDQRRCIYGLFAALSTLLKTGMGEYLETMMHFMLLSLRSSEGVKAHVKEESSFIFDDAEFDAECDIESEEQDAEGDMSDIAGISVENAYMEEKEDTAVAMGEIAVNAGATFLPFLEESYQELLNLLEYPASRVKKGAVTALGQFCECVHEVGKTGQHNSQIALSTMLNTLLPKFMDIITDDADREVVMATVDVIHDLLEKVGQPVLQVPDATDAILSKMKLIFMHKVACQEEEEEGDEDGDQQAEFDTMLIESAGDVIPAMAKLVGGQNFLDFFAGFLPDLLKRMRQTSSTAEKSFAVGTLGETIEAVGPAITVFGDSLYPVFTKMLRDEDDEVRSNSVYSLGVLVSNCVQKMQGRFPEVLKVLFEILNKEKNGRVIDNVCAATCRMVLASQSHVPLEVVVPVIIKCLPMKEDQEENMTVYKCLTQLYAAGNAQVIAGIPDILKAIAATLGTEELKPECEKLMVDLVRDIAGKYPSDFQGLKSSLTDIQQANLDRCLTAVANGH